MKLVVLLLLAVSLPAATIGDTDTSVLLHQGEGLAFEILTWNFGFNATRFGLPSYPTEISFSFVTAPVSGDLPFSALLRSSDGSAALRFPDSLYFTPRLFYSSQLYLSFSTLDAYLQLAG